MIDANRSSKMKIERGSLYLATWKLLLNLKDKLGGKRESDSLIRVDRTKNGKIKIRKTTAKKIFQGSCYRV